MNRTLQRAICAFALAASACAPRASMPADAHAGHIPSDALPPDQHAEHATAQAASVPGANPADVKFMQDMIGHHAQALVMAAMA